MDETTETRWLDEDEHRTWLTLMSLMLQLGPALDARMRCHAGISHFEYTVMAGLSEAPDRTLRMSDIAAFSDGSLSRLSMVVGRLEKKGWVHRRPDPTDGRYTLAILTDAGFEKVVATAPAHVNDVRRMVFDPLTKGQVKQLDVIGRRLLSGIAAASDRRAQSA